MRKVRRLRRRLRRRFLSVRRYCRLRVQSSFGRTDALSRPPFECIARVLPPAGSVVLWADGCIVSASFRVHRRVLPPAGSVVLWADGCIVSASFRVHRPGSAACGFGRPLGGRMHCLGFLSSASPGPAACGFGRSAGGRMHCLDLLSSASPGFCRLRKSVACPRGRDKPAGRSYAPGGGGRLRSGEPSRKRAPEHPVPSDDGERAGIAVRPKKIGTARERQPRPQTPAKELI